jgi:hypothetical protein
LLRLKELRLGYAPGEWAHILEVHQCARVVEQDYDEHRPPMETQSTASVVVRLCGEPIPDRIGRNPRLEARPRSEGAVQEIDVPFDTAAFLAEDVMGRRMFLLNALHHAMVTLAAQQG